MDNSSWSTTIPSQTNAGTYIVYWRVVGDTNHNDISSTSINIEIEDLIEGVFAVTATGKEVRYANINTSTPSAYVGVGVRDSNNNMAFFIDKRCTYGTSNSSDIYNFKIWSNALKVKDTSYLTNISGSIGTGSSIDGAAASDLRTNALNDYLSGKTGVYNTTKICDDTNASSDTVLNNAAKFCRSIINPITGQSDGYLPSIAEYIVVNDNQEEINQILSSIGGIQYSVSGGSDNPFSRYWTSSEYNSSNAWT